MLIDKETNAFMINLPANHLSFSEWFLYEGEQPNPIDINPGDMSSYMNYLNYLRQQEQNHRVYRIKPDLGLEMIPGNIQLAALREGTLRDNEELAELSELLAGIQDERYNNYKAKKKHQYNIFSYQAMQHFAETGKQSDHFWAFRHFTPEETLWIMRDLLTNAQRNRYFHLRFLKGDEPIGQQIAWYEDCGMDILLSSTEYNLKLHSQMRITDPGLCNFFHRDFFGWYADHYAMSEDESLKLLEKLVVICEKRCARC